MASELGLPFGSLLALSLPQWRNLRALCIVFTVAMAGIYLAAAGVGAAAIWATPAGPPILTGCAFVGRIIEAYVMTLVHVLIAERFPEDAQRLSMYTGVLDRVLVLMGTAAAFGLVSLVQQLDGGAGGGVDGGGAAQPQC